MKQIHTQYRIKMFSVDLEPNSLFGLMHEDKGHILVNANVQQLNLPTCVLCMETRAFQIVKCIITGYECLSHINLCYVRYTGVHEIGQTEVRRKYAIIDYTKQTCRMEI